MKRLTVVLAACAVALAASSLPAAPARADADYAALLQSPSWRPFADASPFNQVATSAAPTARSARIAARMLSWGGPGQLALGLGGTKDDYGHPIYVAKATDPQATLRATAPYGRNPLNGKRIPIPADARAAGGMDAHLTVITPDGWEYDFWQVRGRKVAGGKLTFAWGGRTRIDGNGLGGAADAAGYALLAGILRPGELAAGSIDHALFLSARCTAGHVWPATGNGGACPRGMRDAPPMGARVRLNLTPAAIAGLPAAPAVKTILTALATYGGYIGDTGSGSFGVQVESTVDTLVTGAADPFLAAARAGGVPVSGRAATLDLAGGINWKSALQIVAPPAR